MKKMRLWVIVATLTLCGTTALMTSCKEAKANEDNAAPAVKSEELIRTSKSWDGVELPRSRCRLLPD